MSARAIRLDTAELGDKCQLPESQTDQALITAAGVLAGDAENFKPRVERHHDLTNVQLVGSKLRPGS